MSKLCLSARQCSTGLTAPLCTTGTGRWEDYDYDYHHLKGSKQNRFSFMGKGMTTEQIAGEADLSPYLNQPISADLPALLKK